MKYIVQLISDVLTGRPTLFIFSGTFDEKLVNSFMCFKKFVFRILHQGLLECEMGNCIVNHFGDDISNGFLFLFHGLIESFTHLIKLRDHIYESLMLMVDSIDAR